MSKESLLNAIRTIPDFPKPGIMFKDITPVLRDVELCRFVAKTIADQFRNDGIEIVAGIESRGFLFGMMIAQELNCAFAMIRKKESYLIIPWKWIMLWNTEQRQSKFMRRRFSLVNRL